MAGPTFAWKDTRGGRSRGFLALRCPSQDLRPTTGQVSLVIGICAATAQKKNERQRTAGLIRETDVAPLSTLGVGQVEVVLGQTLFAVMPFVEAWWLCAAFRLRETV